MNNASVVTLEIRAVTDVDEGCPALPRLFHEFWPAYQRWMQRAERIDASACTQRLRSCMPELWPIFERLRDRFGGGSDVERFLTMYNPPKLVRACSQLVVDGPDGPGLMHSYDHHPELFDGLVLSSHWSDRATLGVTDCLWGVLSGVNEDGCAVALAFGGRSVVGPGFAAPLVARYILDTCATTQEARAALTRIPVHMAYTFVIVDASGEFVTAFVAPDRPARFIQRRASTNHQGDVEWPAYATQVASEERLRFLEDLLRDGSTPRDVDRQFLRPPIWRTNYAKGSGTLYVSRVSTRDRSVTLHWPATQRRYVVGEHIDGSFTVDLPSATDLTPAARA